ncbi:MAG: hypothetical protein EHM33_03280, partial [Chloroflexi bacterium]
MNTEIKTTETSPAPGTATTLSAGLKLRPAQWADLKPVTQLILDVCIADGDPTVAVTSEELER